VSTKIEWCKNPDGSPGEVWNPVVGCMPVSAGCANCYARALHNKRYQAYWKGAKLPSQYAFPFHTIQMMNNRLDAPLHWKKPRRVFVNSMSDLFHPDVESDFVLRVLSVIKLAERHTFIVLTKRPKPMRDLLRSIHWLPSNMWIGVSVENQAAADDRIPLLLETPAAVRFVSCEPMLEEIDIRDALRGYPVQTSRPFIISREMALDAGDPSVEGMIWGTNEWEQTCPPLNWVICGCESGTSARPFDMDWARSLRDQCQDARVPLFLKQGRIDGRLVKMPELDGRVWDQYPEEPK